MITLIVFVVGLVIFVAALLFFIRGSIVEGLMLFKKNIFLILAISIVICGFVIFRQATLYSIDMFFHSFVTRMNTHSLFGTLILFDTYRSVCPGCTHFNMIIWDYYTQLALAILIFCSKVLIITKSFMILNHMDSSLKSVYETLKSSVIKKKRVLLIICLIEVVPFYLSRTVAGLHWRTWDAILDFFGGHFLIELITFTLSVHPHFLAAVLALLWSVMVSYIICNIMSGNDRVIKTSLVMIKQNFRKLIMLFTAFCGVYGFVYFMFARIWFGLVQRMWDSNPFDDGIAVSAFHARLFWGSFDMFTVALLLLLSTIVVTFFTHASEHTDVADTHKMV